MKYMIQICKSCPIYCIRAYPSKTLNALLNVQDIIQLKSKLPKSMTTFT